MAEVVSQVQVQGPSPSEHFSIEIIIIVENLKFLLLTLPAPDGMILTRM